MRCQYKWKEEFNCNINQECYEWIIDFKISGYCIYSKETKNVCIDLNKKKVLQKEIRKDELFIGTRVRSFNAQLLWFLKIMVHCSSVWKEKQSWRIKNLRLKHKRTFFLFSHQIVLQRHQKKYPFIIDFRRTHEIEIWRTFRELFAVSKKASRLALRR